MIGNVSMGGGRMYCSIVAALCIVVLIVGIYYNDKVIRGKKTPRMKIGGGAGRNNFKCMDK